MYPPPFFIFWLPFFFLVAILGRLPFSFLVLAFILLVGGLDAVFRAQRAGHGGAKYVWRGATSLDEQRQVLSEQFLLSLRLRGEKDTGRLMRKFGIKFSTHHGDPETVRKQFIAVKSIADWERVLEEHYGTDAATAQEAGGASNPSMNVEPQPADQT